MGNIVLVWAGWTGMSGIAGILQELWFTNIICIDSKQSQLTDKLQARWLQTIIWHWQYQIDKNDSIIYSEAAANSPEVFLAKEISKKEKKIMLIMNYFQFLGEISKYFLTIWITWSNGKSSTSALTIYWAKDLDNFGLWILWALVPDFQNQSYLINNNHKAEIKNIFDKILTGRSKEKIEAKKLLFIVEACEYMRHFLYLDLDYATITNIEYDHADYFKSFEDYKKAFKEMLHKLKHNCFVINWFLQQNPEFKIFENIIEIQEEKSDFKYIFGPHTNINASITKALLNTQNPKKIELNEFKWIWRRMEYLWTAQNWATLFSDYGHMASSIKLGFESTNAKFPNKKIITIFQPHQINRIFTGRKDFIQSFAWFEQVYIYDIFAARENIADFDFSKTGKDVHNIKELGEHFAKSCWWEYLEKRESVENIINNAGPDEIVVVFSAWDIDYDLRNKIKLNK